MYEPNDAVEGQWIEAPGYELFPLNRFADRLKVVACVDALLEPGELVIARQRDGRFAARIVISPSPLTLAPLFSSTRAEDERAVGKVVELQRGGHSVPVRSARWLVHAVNRLGTRVRENGLRRAVTRNVMLLPYATPTVAIRRALLGPFSSRRLVAEDAEQLRRLTDAELPAMTDFLVGQLRGRWSEGHGIPVGAFSRRGTLLGMFYVDEYRPEGIDIDGYWMRSLVVAKLARGLGLTRLMGRAAHAEAHRLGVEFVYADVAPENRLVVELMIPRFFATPAPSEVVTRLNQEFVRRGQGDGWTVWRIDRDKAGC